MSLRSKIALGLFLAVAAFVSADFALKERQFATRFEELDAERAPRAAERAVELIEAEIEELPFASAELDRLLGIPETEEKPFVMPAALAGTPVHVVRVVDENGAVLRHRTVDPLTGDELLMRDLPTGALSPSHPLLRVSEGGAPPRGAWATERGVLLVDVRALTSPEGAPQKAIVGRFLDEKLLDKLRGTSGLDLEVHSIYRGFLDEQKQDLLRRVTASPSPVVERTPDDQLIATALIRDIGQSPALLLRVRTPREMQGIWRELRQQSLMSTLALAIIFPLGVLLLLHWIVTGPLARLTAHVVRIEHADDTTERLELNRGDEIGQLSSGFDGMLDKLAHSRAELAHNARLAGMSEISTGVMHNVGTALNSVSISADVIHRNLSGVPASDLNAIAHALGGNADDLVEFLATDPRGKHLPRFFSCLVRDIEQKTGDARCEVESLAQGLEQIVTLIGTLSQFEASTHIFEKIDLAEQLNTVVELCISSAGDAEAITIERDYAAMPRLSTDRHKLLEVLVNLIRNALQSLAEAEIDDPRLNLRIYSISDEEVCLSVEDNGVGIAAGDLQRIFAPRVTVREQGRGLGLHFAANTACEMGGRIAVESAGLGCGALFSLHLPVERSVAASSAER